MLTLFACVLNLVATSAVCHCLRLLANATLPRARRLMAAEFVSTMDLCCGCCELALVCDTHGPLVFGLLLFGMCRWWERVFDGASANPNKYVEDVVRGHMRPRKAGQLIVVQLVAASLVLTSMRFLWSFGWSHAHLEKSTEAGCQADLQVSVKNGAVIEGLVTFIDRLHALTLEDLDYRNSSTATALLSTVLVLSALYSSGGYFNPVLASSLKFGCQGHSFLEFFAVYWLGSLAGSIVALACHQLVGVRRLLELANVLQGVEAKHKLS